MALTVKARFVPDDSAIRRLLTGPTGPVVSFVRQVTRRVRTQAVLRCPVDTGNLRSAHREEVGVRFGHVYGYVINDVEYAEAVHEGTGPHVIRPRRPGGVLRFTVGGEVVFATRVNHPGTRPQPWLEDALTAVALPEGFRLIHTR